MEPILGYWVEDATDIYFVRGAFEALEYHKTAFDQPVEGVTVTPVTKHEDVAPYVIVQHIKKKAIFYTRWTPESPIPIEQDHAGKMSYEVLDFAETIEEAEAVVKQLKLQK